MQDRRNHHRHEISVPVFVGDDTIAWAATTENVSRTGALVHTDALVREGEFVYFAVPGHQERAIGWIVRESDADEGEQRPVVVSFRNPIPASLSRWLDDLDLFYLPVDEPAS